MIATANEYFLNVSLILYDEKKTLFLIWSKIVKLQGVHERKDTILKCAYGHPGIEQRQNNFTVLM